MTSLFGCSGDFLKRLIQIPVWLSLNLVLTKAIKAFLKEHQLPTIYASSGSLQTTEEALETAKKYDAYYYGPFRKGVPIDNAHFQFDSNQGGKGPGGHMKAEGCEIVAKTMAPLIEQILTEKNIH